MEEEVKNCEEGGEGLENIDGMSHEKEFYQENAFEEKSKKDTGKFDIEEDNITSTANIDENVEIVDAERCMKGDKNIVVRELREIIGEDFENPGNIMQDGMITRLKEESYESLTEHVEQSMFKAGDTVIQSKPFAFIIHASHRSKQ